MSGKTLTSLLGAAALALTFGGQGAFAQAPTQDQAPAEDTAKAPARVQVTSSQPFGSYLVDARGMSLYLFEPDRSAKGSTCYGACAEAWPPLLTDGDPRAAAPSLDAAKLGTITRRDGKTQVTYGGWPLYLYAPDKQPGDTKGQDVHSFGGGWYLLSPEGQKIEATRGPTRDEPAQP